MAPQTPIRPVRIAEPAEPLPPDVADRLRQLFTTHTFVFAKTMAHNPHYYTVRKTWDCDADFVWAVEQIRRYGHKERFGRSVYTLLVLDDYKYWTMGSPLPETILINRKRYPGADEGVADTP